MHVHTRAVRDDCVLLADGTYDAFIVWADARDSVSDEQNIAFELAITTGEHKGDVVEVLASNVRRANPIDLVGLPCTLVVAQGEPRIVV
jgi:hypothetical protein